MDEEINWVIINPRTLQYTDIQYGEVFPRKTPIHLPLGQYELSVKIEKAMGVGAHALYNSIFDEAGKIIRLAKGGMVIIMSDREALDYDHYAKINNLPVGDLKLV